MGKREHTVLLLAGLLLLGCSGGTPAPESSAGAGKAAAAPDACAVVTADDVSEALGAAAKVQNSDHLETISTTSMCTYETVQGAQNLVSVVIRVGPPGLDAEANLTQYVAGIKNNMGNEYRVDRIEGLGGLALWNPQMNQLTVFKNATLVIFTLFETTGKDPLDTAKSLAAKALPHIT